jgi:hypothetical protein
MSLRATVRQSPYPANKASPLVPNDIRLKWVLADPASERAVDPLGMGTQADQIADLLLPQLSVATTRARYFSFLCWAVRKSSGVSAPMIAIHRLEAELALGEARRHHGEPPQACPGVIGRTRAASYLEEHDGKAPERPERLYKNTAFATYRPAMRALGLLVPSRSPALTDAGKRLAIAFDQSRGRNPCLGDISAAEKVTLRVLLGLDYRKQSALAVAPARRRATFEAVGQALGPDQDAASVLEQNAHIGRRPTDVAIALQRAFVWELLSCGLTLAFSMLLAEQRTRPIVRALKQELGRQPHRPALGPLSADHQDSAGDVVALLRAATHFQPEKLALDPWPGRLAARLVRERDPHGFLRELAERHRMAKPEGPWIALAADKVQILAPKKSLSFEVRPRTYRLDAFNQLLRDLRMIP